METVTTSPVLPGSSMALNSRVTTVSVAPLSGPVKVTLGAVPRSLQVTPSGSLSGQASSKLVPTVPPRKASGISRASPLTSPRPRVSVISAFAVASPSVAVAPVTSMAAVVASSSVMVMVNLLLLSIKIVSSEKLLKNST